MLPVLLCALYQASLVVQTVQNPPAMRETWVQFLDQENPLEKGMVIRTSILAWRIPWIEESGKVPSMRSFKESDKTERLSTDSTNI